MSEKKTKLFRIRKTVCKMLNARGYLVAQAELDRDKDSFTEEFGEDPRRDALTLQFDLREDPKEGVYVSGASWHTIGKVRAGRLVMPPAAEDVRREREQVAEEPGALEVPAHLRSRRLGRCSRCHRM